MQHPDRLEGVALELLHQFRFERLATSGGAEGAIARRAAGAAGDLSELRRRQLAKLVTVELAIRGKGDMIDVEIEAHADGVGGNEIIDVTRLIERDLSVACAR